ncbi:MAG: tryptophan synthase subunit alpha [Acidimicrobiia bacterium]
MKDVPAPRTSPGTLGGRAACTRTNALLRTLEDVRREGRMALCGYFLAGFPTPVDFFRLLRAVHQLDVVEIGIPAPEPRMDGAVIARAHDVVTRDRGLDAETALALIGGLGPDALPQPRLAMTYADVGRELDGFLDLCRRNRIDGLLVPDVDPVEGAYVADRARAIGLASVTLLDARADDRALEWAVSQGDVVYVKASPAATTGAAATIDGELRDQLAEMRGRLRAAAPELPVAVGIGLQRPEQLAAVAELGFDMAVVGSKLVEHVAAGGTDLGAYLRSLRGATSRARPRRPTPPPPRHRPR